MSAADEVKRIEQQERDEIDRMARIGMSGMEHTNSYLQGIRHSLLSARARAEVEAKDRRIAELEAEVKRVRGLIDRDRTGLAAGLNEVRKAVGGWSWLGRDEWGSYTDEEQTEETLRKEIGTAFETILAICEKHLNDSGKRAYAAFHGGEAP